MFSQIFIDRPKLAIVISVVTVLVGLLCVFQAPIAEYPEIAPPAITVWATYTGAGSEEVANTVATVIEEQMNGLEHLLYFTSTSSNTGTYSLELTFKSGIDTDIAQVNVQNAVRRAEPMLPQVVKDNGIKIFKRSSDMLSAYSFTTDGSEVSLIGLSNFIRTNIRDPMSRVDGISEVNIMGERNYSMRIWLDPVHMSALQIKPEDVAAAVQSQNVQAAAGAVGVESSNDFIQLKVNALGRLKTVEEFGNIVVRSGENGSQVMLRDIARIELGAENYTHNSSYNGDGSIGMIIYRNTDANAIDVVNRANALLESLRPSFPRGVDYHIAYDPTKYIRISMREIAETLVLTLVLVVAITYVFLQDWRATLIPSLTIPVSLIGTFIFLIPLGFSINLLTMFGLILVIGSLVDDAIVVTENCMRIIEEEHLPPKEAASKSMKQITGAIIATTLVVVAIYAPVAFYGGMVGTIYLQFAVTMCIALCLSTVNALTLSPALCGLLLRNKPPAANPLFRGFNRMLDWSRRGYLSISGFLLRYLMFAVLIFAAVIFGNVFFYRSIHSSFLPDEDKGALLCSVELPPGASLNRTTRAQDQVETLVRGIPGVENVMSISGFSFTAGVGENVGASIISLTDWSERRTPELEIASIQQKIQAAVSRIPSARVMVFQPPAIMGLGATGGVTFMLSNTGEPDAQELFNAMVVMLGEINSWPEVMSAFSSYEAGTPQVFLNIDRNKAEAMGVPVSRIFTTLQSKLASSYINDFNLRGYSFKVKMQAEAGDRSTLDDISQLMVQNDSGKMVPLSSFAEIEHMAGPRLITRFNQNMSAKIFVQGMPGVSSSFLMKKIETALRDKLPREYAVNWVDMSYQERGNEGRIVILLAFALIFGYLFLVGQYESWTIPMPVVASFAVAMLGGFLGLLLSGMDFSIYAQLGIVMLIGLSCKNAILMVEFSKQEREAGRSINTAAQQGFSQRYRAVLMTAWSFVIGVFPMVVATGAGAGSRRAIGVTTFYGMLLATVFGIVLIPPSYAFFQRNRERMLAWFHGRRYREQDQP